MWFLCGIAYFAFYARHRLILSPEEEFAMAQQEVVKQGASCERHRFADLKTLLAKATPARSGDELAGIAAATAEERVAAQMALPMSRSRRFLTEP